MDHDIEIGPSFQPERGRTRASSPPRSGSALRMVVSVQKKRPDVLRRTSCGNEDVTLSRRGGRTPSCAWCRESRMLANKLTSTQATNSRCVLLQPALAHRVGLSTSILGTHCAAESNRINHGISGEYTLPLDDWDETATSEAPHFEEESTYK